jgi:hypothetical protein
MTDKSETLWQVTFVAVVQGIDLKTATESARSLIAHNEGFAAQKIERIEDMPIEPAALPPRSLSFDAIVDQLRAAGWENAYVEQTGGGCATIFAGPTHEVEGYGDVYAVAVGPGWFEGPGWTDGRGHAGDLYVGPDSGGEDVESTTVPEGATVDDVVRLALSYLDRAAGLPS